jgi:hypothetical protein
MPPYYAIVDGAGRPFGIITVAAKHEFGWHEGVAGPEPAFFPFVSARADEDRRELGSSTDYLLWMT